MEGKRASPFDMEQGLYFHLYRTVPPPVPIHGHHPITNTRLSSPTRRRKVVAHTQRPILVLLIPLFCTEVTPITRPFYADGTSFARENRRDCSRRLDVHEQALAVAALDNISDPKQSYTRRHVLYIPG